MADYTNRGILFVNDRKKPGSKEPDRRGRINVNGTDFELAGWLNEGKDGRKYLALRIKPAGEHRTSARETAAADEPESF